MLRSDVISTSGSTPLSTTFDFGGAFGLQMYSIKRGVSRMARWAECMSYDGWKKCNNSFYDTMSKLCFPHQRILSVSFSTFTDALSRRYIPE